MIVVSLTRSQENQLMRPRMALAQAGAFGLNLILKSEAHGSDVDAAIDAAIEAAMAKKKRRRARRARLKAKELAGEGKPAKRGWFSRGGGRAADELGLVGRRDGEEARSRRRCSRRRKRR